MNKFLMTETELRQQDDGRILDLFKYQNSFKAILNIFPYKLLSIPKETFDEWLQFCEQSSQDEDNYIHYPAKHWNKL